MADAKIRSVLKWVLVGISLFFFGFLFISQWFLGVDQRIYDQIIEHYAVFLGLPCAGFAALLVVVLLDQTFGEIKFTFFNMKFEGAAGQIIFWVICYLSIVFSIKLLW